MFALINNTEVRSFETIKEAKKTKRFPSERIVKYRTEDELTKLIEHLNKQRERFLIKPEIEVSVIKWDFEKLSDQIKIDLRKAYEEKNFPRVKIIILENKVMPNCGSCGYKVEVAAEWIEDAITKNIL